MVFIIVEFLVILHGNKKYNNIDCFFVGNNENVLNMPDLININFAGISSYGGVSSGSMRIGFKCKFREKN